MKSKKKNFLIPSLLAVLILGILAWNFSQKDSLLGGFATSPVNPSDYTQSRLDAMTMEELVTGAETQMNNAEAYEIDAMAAEATAITAYNDMDEDALVIAQADATESAENADAAATVAERYADELLSRYNTESKTESMLETKDKVTGGVDIQELIQDAGARYESAKVQYEVVFEPYWEYWIDVDPYGDATDQIPTEDYVIDEWPTEIITQTDFWTDYIGARADYFDAYNDLAGLFDLVELTDANTSYLEGIQGYESQRLEFETNVIDYSINQTLLNNGSMQDMNAGFEIESQILGASKYTLLQTQMGSYLSAQDLVDTNTIEIMEFQFNQTMMQNYNFQNNVTGAVELASGPTAASLYASYVLAQSYAVNANVLATLAENYAISANLYEILACLSLMVTPPTYQMEATDSTADFQIVSMVTLTPAISGTYTQWMGTLSFTSTGSGTFDQGATPTEALSIPMTSSGVQLVNFTEGVANETITIEVVGEPVCTKTVTITQTAAEAAAEDEVDPSTDTDGDGLTDLAEDDLGTYPDDEDSDDDGLLDGREVFGSGTNPLDPDSDDDGLDDGDEVMTYETDPLDTDSDDDGLTDYEEVTTYLTDPNEEDTDGDGLTDYEEVMTYETDPNDTDSDDDGLTDYEEVITYETDPNDTDSDDDGVDDYNEVTNGTDPNVADSEEEDPLEDEDYVCEEPFVDVLDEDWSWPIVCRMYNADVVNGRTETYFIPNDQITRAEAIKMVVILLLEKEEADADGLEENFSDVSSSDWFQPYIAIAEDDNVIRINDFGEDFYPNEAITRGDLALYVTRAIGLTSYSFELSFSDVNESDYFAYAIDLLSEEMVDVPYDDDTTEVAVIGGYEDNTFLPYEDILRSEALAMIYRAYLAEVAE